MDGGDVLLQAIDIRKSYGAAVALDGVSLDIRAGEFLTLLGPSGSGKTTFLMILGGFTVPTSGRLLHGGADVTFRPPEQRRYGMVFQGYALFPHMTVEENIAFPLRVQRVPAALRRRKLDEIIGSVGLDAHRAKRPGQLSGGQQQRVALARALVFQPEVLLLDEPLSALDKSLREQMQGEIRRLHQQTGGTFVFVTHDQTEALALSTRVAIFDHGRLQQVATPEAVYERPDNRFVAEFLGRINLFAVRDVARDGRVLRGAFEDRTLAAPAGANAAGKRAMIAVRPEYMQLTDGPAAECNAVAVRITARQYGGADALVQARTRSGTEIVLMLPSSVVAVPGAEVWVSWPATSGFVIADD